MHLLEKPVDYSKSEEFNKDINKLTLEDAKILVKKLYEDNRNYKQLAARAAITVEQYKHLLSVFDGYSEDKENMNEANSIAIRKIIVGTFDASRNLCFWMKTLCEASKRIVFEDEDASKIFSLIGNVCCDMYTLSCDLRARKILLPEEPVGVCVRNLERTEEKIEDPPRGFYSHQSVLINRQKENTNKFHKTGKHSHQHQKPSVNEEITSLQDEEDDDDDDDERSGEESHDSSSKQGASTCENDCSQGGEYRYGKETHENFERRKKTFGITYPKSQNFFKHDRIHSKRTCSNISARGDESEHSDNDIDEDNQSLNENDMTQDTGTYSGLVSSKGSSKYKKKHQVNKQEGNVTKRGRKKRKSPASQNSETVAKKPRRYRKSHDSITLENSDDVKGMDDSEIDIHPSSSSSSKRYQRSKKYETSNIHKTELGKTSSRKKGQNVKKHDSGSEAGTSSVKSKKNRRGRRKKLSVTLEQEANKTLISRKRDDSVSSKNVPHNLDNVTKHAYVRLTNVLDDPEAQHYTDVIQYKEKNRNECDSGVRWKERTETEETSSNKERNEIEALQEWNVLDAVSDEEDKEFDNTEDAEASNNCQASDSDAEQEETINDDDDDYDDDKGQLEIDYDDKELEDSSDGGHEESCAAKQDSNRNCDSETESKEYKKGPSTPDVSPHESEYEDNSDVQDENDGDADSIKSNDDEDISSRSRTSGSPLYGKKGPRTPPSPAPFEPLRRGPQTPPGSGPDPEVLDDEENDSEYESD